MLKIILSRIGKKHQPFYRIAVFESQKDPWGNYLEKLGHYNPKTKELKLEAEKIKQWLAKGAKPSATVHNLLVENKIIDDKKITVTKISKKRKEKIEVKKKNQKETEEKAKAAIAEQEKTAETAAAPDVPKDEQPK
ncbi:MAG: 30S ribosomal protein S16 [Patescibacteria group bacterium]